MRKILLVMVALMLLTMGGVWAHDEEPLTPIVALAGQKLYAVSPVDGSTRLLAERKITEQPISPLRVGSISPDGERLVFMTQSSPDVPMDKYGSHLYLLTIRDDTIAEINPSGGVFDVAAPAGAVFAIQLPTWSSDGQRIYYTRRQFALGHGAEGKLTQLAYYDVATQKHVLVARLDPANLMVNLQAVAGGMVVRWTTPGSNRIASSVLYGPDNQAGPVQDVTGAYAYVLHGTDGDYYAYLNDMGDIQRLVNVATGDEQPAGVGYYPAAQSRKNSAHSLNVFSVQYEVATFFVYGEGAFKGGTSFDNTAGFAYALSPDGQEMAFLQLSADDYQVPIQVLDMSGAVRELDFKAEQVLWGAVQFVAFPAPG